MFWKINAVQIQKETMYISKKSNLNKKNYYWF